MDTISTSRVGSFSKGVVKYRMVWRAGVVAWDHVAGANMQVIASTSAMINFCMSSSPELVHTRYTTCEADRSALGDDPDRMRPMCRLRSVFRDKITLDRRPDVPDYDPAERILNHVPHDLLRFDL